MSAEQFTLLWKQAITLSSVVPNKFPHGGRRFARASPLALGWLSDIAFSSAHESLPNEHVRPCNRPVPLKLIKSLVDIAVYTQYIGGLVGMYLGGRMKVSMPDQYNGAIKRLQPYLLSRF